MDQKPKSKSLSIIILVSVLFVILCVCVLVIGVVAILLLVEDNQDFSNPSIPALLPYETTDVVFEITVPENIAIQQADIDRAIQTIKSRCKLMKVKCASVESSDNSHIMVKVSQDVDLAWFAESIRMAGLVEFVDVGANYLAPGDPVNTDYEPFLSQAGEPVYHTIMTNYDVLSAEEEIDELGNIGIAFTLTQEGKTIFAEHTRNHIGEYLALVLDKRVIICPIINAEIKDGKGTIAGHFTNVDTVDGIDEETSDYSQNPDVLKAFLLTQPLPFLLTWESE